MAVPTPPAPTTRIRIAKILVLAGLDRRERSRLRPVATEIVAYELGDYQNRGNVLGATCRPGRARCPFRRSGHNQAWGPGELGRSEWGRHMASGGQIVLQA